MSLVDKILYPRSRGERKRETRERVPLHTSHLCATPPHTHTHTHAKLNKRTDSSESPKLHRALHIRLQAAQRLRHASRLGGALGACACSGSRGRGTLLLWSDTVRRRPQPPSRSNYVSRCLEVRLQLAPIKHRPLGLVFWQDLGVYEIRLHPLTIQKYCTV